MTTKEIMSKENNIPKHWQVRKLSEIGKCVTGTTPPKNDSKNYGSFIPFVKPPQLFDKQISDAPEKLSKKGAELSRILPENSILVTCIGNLGRTAINKIPVAFNQQINAIIPFEKIEGRFLFYQTQSYNFRKQLDELSSATTVSIVNKGKFETIKIVLPPLPEQQAIVSRIEELLSDLDNGKQQLQGAQQQLKTYRQSLLKWAFEGKLTRLNHDSADLYDVHDSEKQPQKNQSNHNNQNNHSSDNLPKGWEIVELKDVAEKITDGEHFRPITQNSGIPFLSAKDVRDFGVSFDDPLFISEETAKKAMQRCNPQKGDVLIVSRGATVGRMCIVNTDKQFCLLGSVILIKVNQLINSKYLNFVLKSPIANQKMITVSGATAQQAIYLRDIKNISVPLPPLKEQLLIVSELESKLTVCDKIEETISEALLKSESLRQSILKKAFSGELIKNYSNS